MASSDTFSLGTTSGIDTATVHHHHHHHRHQHRSTSRSRSPPSSSRKHHHHHRKESKHHRHHSSHRDNRSTDNRQKNHKHHHHHHRSRRHRSRSSSSSSSSSSSTSSSSRSPSRSIHAHAHQSSSASSLTTTGSTVHTVTPSNLNNTALTTKGFGYYGILRQYDMHKKQREFEAWLTEVKRLPDFHGTKNEMLEYWKEYAEDYNTVTLPHEKYYDLEKYETLMGGKDKVFTDGRNSGNFSILDDAEQRRLEKQRQLKQQELQQIALYRSGLAATTIEGMKRQQELQQQMEYAFRGGNIKEVERIKRLLEPDKK